jgi:signal peptidase II
VPGALRLGLIVILISIVADQVTKQMALAYFKTHDAVSVLPFFDLTLAWNRGVSFGMFGDGGVPAWALAAVSLVIAAFLTWQMLKATARIGVIGFALIIGGALGNVIDRGIYGAVIDFILLHYERYSWPVFNIADTAITFGVVLILIDSLWSKPASTTS